MDVLPTAAASTLTTTFDVCPRNIDQQEAGCSQIVFFNICSVKLDACSNEVERDILLAKVCEVRIRFDLEATHL